MSPAPENIKLGLSLTFAEAPNWKSLRGHIHIQVATNNVELTLLFHPPTPDNVDRYSVTF